MLNNIVNIEDTFRNYKHKIYGLALSITRDAKEADDILQDVFLKIIKNIDTFKGKSSLSTWIYRIAYNEALMHLRQRKKLSRVSYSEDNESQISSKDIGLFINWPTLPYKEAEEHELITNIDKAIALMPIKYRLVLLLRTLEGLSVKETAEILKLKENSVKSRLHRARLIIHKELIDYENKHQPESSKNKDDFCSIATRFIYDYIEGHLAKTQQNDFKKHITDCQECNIFLDTYTKAIAITNALQCLDIPPVLQDKIKNFIAKSKPISS